MVKAVHNNLGISLLPEELVEEDIKSGFVKTLPIADADFSRTFRIVWHREKFLTSSMKEIIRVLKQKQYSCKETEE